MHTAHQLALVLAAEKSKVPYYIIGGALVLWALTLSLALGLRKADFPGSLGGQRVVSAVSIVLVIATLTAAVLTSGTPAKPASAAAAQQTTSGATAPSAGGTSSGSGAHLQVAADSSGLLRFDTSSLSAHAGTVTITMANSSPLEHNLTIAQGTSVLGATPTFSGG